MKKRGIRFHEGIPELSDLVKWFPQGGILVMDDLMDEGGSDSASWISSPNIRIIETLRSCIYVKACFLRGNMPRAFPEKLITL